MLRAYRDGGVDETAHLLIVTCRRHGSILVKKDAFSDEELAAIERLTHRSDG